MNAQCAEASWGTWTLTRLWPRRAEVSTQVPGSLARRASSGVMRPGWASKSTDGEVSAAQLVLGSTGSAIVSPCTFTSFAPWF